MGLITDIGRSGALRRVTGEIRDTISRKRAEKRQAVLDENQSEKDALDLGFKQRAEDRAVEGLGIKREASGATTELKRIEIRENRDEEARRKVWQPLDQVRAKMNVTDRVWDRMVKVAGDRITVIGGVAGAEVGAQEDTIEEIGNNLKMQKVLDMDAMLDLNESKGQVYEAFKNPKLKPEEMTQLQQSLAQINMGISAIATRQKPLDLAIQKELRDETLKVEEDKRGSDGVNKRIATLEKARFNAVNKGKRDPALELYAAERGISLPGIGEPKGLARYLDFIDTQIEELGGEKILTDDLIQEYIDAAGGDKKLAEQNALQDGYSIR